MRAHVSIDISVLICPDGPRRTNNMTTEQVKFFLEWAVLRANQALLENGVLITEATGQSIKSQIMRLMTQVEFRMADW
jgi:hypothetical protein